MSESIILQDQPAAATPSPAASVRGRATGAAYASRFERRPEFELWGSLVPDVIDASSVRKRMVEDLEFIRIADVFAGTSEIFIGFGKPNAYLVVPDGKGGYQKFAGKSLKLAPSRIEDTRGWVQSGILLRLKNLPEGIDVAIRAAMEKHNNVEFWTCVNAILHVLSDSGFGAIPDTTEVERRYMPYALMHAMLRGEITFGGKPLEFEVIRTTDHSLQRYAAQVVKAELLTLCRHGDRKMQAAAKAKKWYGRLYATVQKATAAPLAWAVGKAKAARPPKAPVAPALPADVDYAGGLNVMVTRSSLAVAFLRQFWGSHALFMASQVRVQISDFLTGVLAPFPQANPNFVTRLKKAVLFSPLVVKGIRRLLACDYISIGNRLECDVYDMLRTHSERARNIYNLVLTDEHIIIARISIRARIIDWILSKHVLMSGYHPAVRFAGEIWKDEHGVIHINRNSGTYQPTLEQLQMAAAFLRAVFSHLTVVIDEAL